MTTGGIEVDVPAARRAYDSMEERKEEIQASDRQLEQAVTDIRGHWNSPDKAPPFHNAMEEIRGTFKTQVEQLVSHIDHSRTDLATIGGF